MNTDKRQDPRFDSTQELWCEGQRAFGIARNMSRGGMFVVTDQLREIGEQLNVSFEGDEDGIELELQVMWRGTPPAGGQPGMGLRIVGFGKGEDVYDRYVRAQLGGGRRAGS